MLPLLCVQLERPGCSGGGVGGLVSNQTTAVYHVVSLNLYPKSNFSHAKIQGSFDRRKYLKMIDQEHLFPPPTYSVRGKNIGYQAR